MSDTEQSQSTDPFTQFWHNVATGMGMPGYPSPLSSEEAIKQIQRTFLDALAKYCDEFMRSPQFLDMLKQTMDNAFNLRQQVNQFLEQAQSDIGTPSKGDVADLVAATRAMEERVLGRVEQLERRVNTLASKLPSQRAPKQAPRQNAPPKKKAKAARNAAKTGTRKSAKKKVGKRR